MGAWRVMWAVRFVKYFLDDNLKNMRWKGHVARMGMIKNTYSMLLWNPQAGLHLELFIDLRIILKCVVRNGDCMSWRLWRFAVGSDGFLDACLGATWPEDCGALRTCRPADGEETNWCASGRHFFMLGLQRHTPAVAGHATHPLALCNVMAVHRLCGVVGEKNMKYLGRHYCCLNRLAKNYNFACCSVWVWNLVTDIKWGT